MTRRAFGEAAHPGAAVRREGLPKPDKLVEKGVTTRDTLDWMAARNPKEPAHEHHIDNASLRSEATQNARENYRALIEKLRADFRNRSAKGRQDFRVAQAYQRPERER